MSTMHETKLITLLLTITLLSGITLISSKASADTEVIDQVRLTVPIACTMTGEGTSHTATLDPGTYSGATGSGYENGIGKTTLTAICNDDNGFSIYAIGYTDNQYEGENHTKLIGQSTSSTISTKAYASGDTASNWSMKLTKVTDSTISYNPQNLTITTDYDNWHAVPDAFAKVAEYHANTGSSTTDTTLGVKLETTYAAYISSSQPADTYVGQVKYTLVHPSSINPNYLSVIYNGNGLYFDNNPNKTTNTMQYDAKQVISSDPITKISRSIYNEDGTYGGYADKGGNDVVTINGAEKLHIRVTYGVPENNGGPASDLYVWSGKHPDYTNANNTTSLTSCGSTTATDGAFKSNGQPGSQVTMECDIDSNSVTFYDYSQYSVSTGYYAVVTSVGDVTSYPKTLEYGTYSNPADDEGTVFLGWSTDPNAIEPTYINNTDFIENANYANLDGTVTLYAIWQGSFNKTLSHANKTQQNGYYKMQDVDNRLCDRVLMDSIGTLIDERDNNTYMVRKLKDGRCWMLDNLALDPTDSTTAANMNALNTNATQEAITNLLNGGSSTAGWSSVAVENKITGWNTTSPNNAYEYPYVNNQSKDTLVTSYGPASTNGQAKVGIYYNFCAASASTYCYASGSGVDVPDTIIDAPQDICPANWRMPTGGNAGEYYILTQKYSKVADNTDSLQYNLSTPFSGYYWADSAINQGVRGNYWSSSFGTIDDMEEIGVGPNEANLYVSGRADGYTIRCLVSL